MNRRNFFSRLFTGLGALVVLPKAWGKEPERLPDGSFTSERYSRCYAHNDDGTVVVTLRKEYYAFIAAHTCVKLTPIHPYDASDLFNCHLRKIVDIYSLDGGAIDLPTDVFECFGTWYYMTTDVPPKNRGVR